jgi:hypothetical protein
VVVDLEAVANQALEEAWAARTQSQPVVPRWFLVKHGRVSVLSTPWQGTDEKRAAIALVASRVRKRRPDAVVFLSDTWVRQRALPQDQPATAEILYEYLYGESPSEAVDSVEALIAEIFSRDRTWMKLRAYRQRDNGALEIVEEYTAKGTSMGAVNKAILRALWGR